MSKGEFIVLNALGLSGSGNKEIKSGSNLDAIRSVLQKQHIVITGIGSRETPQEDLEFLTKLGAATEARGWRGRSGGAGGADLAFEKGFKDPRNIDVIVPWRGFLPMKMNEKQVSDYLGRQRPSSGPGAPVMLSGEKKNEAERIASQFHPAWDKCTSGAKSLHTRNVPQVLGLDLRSKTDLVVCYTIDGKATGGTGQAMRIAMNEGIPIANLKIPEERKLLEEFFELGSGFGKQMDAQKAAFMAQSRSIGR